MLTRNRFALAAGAIVATLLLSACASETGATDYPLTAYSLANGTDTEQVGDLSEIVNQDVELSPPDPCDEFIEYVLQNPANPQLPFLEDFDVYPSIDTCLQVLQVEHGLFMGMDLASLPYSLRAYNLGFNRDYPSSMELNGNITVINKRNRIIPSDYSPIDLVEVPGGSLVSERIFADLMEMLAAAESDGVPMRVVSGYRSYQRQRVVHANAIQRLGIPEALRWSARQGHSEHQTGLAVDLFPAIGNHSCQAFNCFAATPHATWLGEHATRFGFIVRYFDGSEPITGFAYEPWHLRWIGQAAVDSMRATGYYTLEEFFGLEPAPEYLD